MTLLHLSSRLQAGMCPHLVVARPKSCRGGNTDNKSLFCQSFTRMGCVPKEALWFSS